MAETLSTILQQIYRDLGQGEEFVATGGSATTAANSFWGDLDNPPEESRFKNSYIFVTRDAGGASASPEGKWGRVTAYDTSTYTLTHSTVTDAIAAGDTILFANTKQFGLYDVIAAVNRGLRELGYIPSEDTSLTTTAEQTEFTIPAAMRGRPLWGVWIQTKTGDANDNQWEVVNGWKHLDSTTLYIPQQTSGYTLKLGGWQVHGELTAYDSALSVYVPKPLAVAAGKAAVLESFIAKRGDNVDKNWRAMYQEALNQREALKQSLDIWRPAAWRRQKFTWSVNG